MISRKAGKPLLVHLALAGILLAVMLTSARPSHAQGKTPAPAKPPMVTIQQLTPEQRDYFREQARYYKSQVEKPWWRYLVESGAFVAAVGALITFSLNYRATIRAQKEARADSQRRDRDTQFYEALKRFGDPSPAVRATAAGLLSQMAMFHKEYVETAIDQLTVGLELDEDPVAVFSIGKGLSGIIGLEPVRTSLPYVNQRLSRAFVRALADFVAASGVKADEVILDDVWTSASRGTRFTPQIVRAISQMPGYSRDFTERLQTSPYLHSIAGTASGRFDPSVPRCQLLIGAERLHASLVLLALLITCYSELGRTLAGSDFGDAFLATGDLTGAHLQGVNLESAILNHAKLAGIQIDSKTRMRGSTWWAADFYDSSGQPHIQVLEQLYQDYREEVPTDPSKLHKSVRDFIAQKCREEQGKQADS